LVAIEEVKVGDQVLSKDVNTGETSFQKVARVYSRTIEET
jgi:hypothetical protein